MQGDTDTDKKMVERTCRLRDAIIDLTSIKLYIDQYDIRAVHARPSIARLPMYQVISSTAKKSNRS